MNVLLKNQPASFVPKSATAIPFRAGAADGADLVTLLQLQEKYRRPHVTPKPDRTPNRVMYKGIRPFHPKVEREITRMMKFVTDQIKNPE